MKKGIVVLFLVWAMSGWGQSMFQMTYGGSDVDQGRSIQQTSDGGYIIAGEGRWGNNIDVHLIKTDANGDTLWAKSYGNNRTEVASCVQQTSDGGYVMVAEISGFSGENNNIYLIKTNSVGDTLWTKIFDGGGYDYGYSIQQTWDAGYIIAGYTSSFGDDMDAYLIKTDSNGVLMWSKTYGNLGSDYAYCVQQTSDGGYICAGGTHIGTPNYSNVLLFKTDINGVLLWAKRYGGIYEDAAFFVRQTSDGGYIICGSSWTWGAGASDVYLIKTDSIGITVWSKTFGGENYDHGYSIQQTSDSGYIIAGDTKSFGAGDEDVYLIKTNSIGDTIWTKTFGGIGLDRGYSVQQTIDGNYVVVGITGSFGVGNYDVYFIKTDVNGNSGCYESNPPTIQLGYPSPSLSVPQVVTTTMTYDSAYNSIVESRGYIKTVCMTVNIQSTMPNSETSINIYPNPTHSNSPITFTYPSTSTKKEIIIHSIHGKEIVRYELLPWSSTQTVKLPQMASGVYVARMVGEDVSANTKFVIE
jgi:hypothetical protein